MGTWGGCNHDVFDPDASRSPPVKVFELSCWQEKLVAEVTDPCNAYHLQRILQARISAFGHVLAREEIEKVILLF